MTKATATRLGDYMTAGNQASSLSDKRRETNCSTTTRAGVGNTGSANRARGLDWTEPVVLDDDPSRARAGLATCSHKSFITNGLLQLRRPCFPR